MSKKQTAQEKALAWYRKLENGPAFGRVAAYIAYIATKMTYGAEPGSAGKGGKAAGVIQWGKILVAYPADGAGVVHVFAWDTEGNGVQHGSASGYGYDKVSTALCGMIWDGLTFGDHCRFPGNWEKVLWDNGYTVYRAI